MVMSKLLSAADSLLPLNDDFESWDLILRLEGSSMGS